MNDTKFPQPQEKPDAKDTTIRVQAPIVPIHLPRIPKEMFPITSEQDLMEKLNALLMPHRPITDLMGGIALPASHPAPPRRRQRRQQN